MQRSAFLRSFIAAAGLCQGACAAPALALDEAAVGANTFAELRDAGVILFDSPYYEHLNEVGAVIAATVRDRYAYPLRFYIVRGDSANAFSVPGGNIYVNEPLLQLTRNRDELAGVLAHESGHMVLHHVAKRLANAQTAGKIGAVFTFPLQIFLGPLFSLPAQGAVSGLEYAQDANLSKHIETQADEEGARILAATQVYNPYGMIWFFTRMTKRYGSKGTSWLRSHPFDSTRVATLERLFRSDPKTFGSFDATDREDDAYW